MKIKSTTQNYGDLNVDVDNDNNIDDDYDDDRSDRIYRSQSSIEPNATNLYCYNGRRLLNDSVVPIKFKRMNKKNVEIKYRLIDTYRLVYARIGRRRCHLKTVNFRKFNFIVSAFEFVAVIYRLVFVFKSNFRPYASKLFHLLFYT